MPVTSHGVPYTAATSPAPARRYLAPLPQPGRDPRPGAAGRRWLHHRPRNPPHQTGVTFEATWNFAIFPHMNWPGCCASAKFRRWKFWNRPWSASSAGGWPPGHARARRADRPKMRQRVHAFISFTEDQARAQAEAVDQQDRCRRRPRPAGRHSLHGQGYFLRARHAFHRRLAHPGQFRSPYTATPVERMLAAGGGDAGQGQPG